MAIGIGQQLKDMVSRARHYWSDLTDGAAQRGQDGRDELDEEVHQRYGSDRTTETKKNPGGRQPGTATRGQAAARTTAEADGRRGSGRPPGPRQ